LLAEHPIFIEAESGSYSNRLAPKEAKELAKKVSIIYNLTAQELS